MMLLLSEPTLIPLAFRKTRIMDNFISKSNIILIMSGLGKMEKIAEGISDFGDFKAILFRTSNGRHFVRFEPLGGHENAHVEWLNGDDHLEWLRCWDHESTVEK